MLASLQYLAELFYLKRVPGSQITKYMRKSLGFVITLYALSQFFTSAFSALDDAARESFVTLETAAKVTRLRLQ